MFRTGFVHGSLEIWYEWNHNDLLGEDSADEVIGQTDQITGPWFKRDVESDLKIIYINRFESNFWS